MRSVKLIVVPIFNLKNLMVLCLLGVIGCATQSGERTNDRILFSKLVQDQPKEDQAWYCEMKNGFKVLHQAYGPTEWETRQKVVGACAEDNAVIYCTGIECRRSKTSVIDYL